MFDGYDKDRLLFLRSWRDANDNKREQTAATDKNLITGNMSNAKMTFVDCKRRTRDPDE